MNDPIKAPLRTEKGILMGSAYQRKPFIETDRDMLDIQSALLGRPNPLRTKLASIAYCMLVVTALILAAYWSK